MTHIAYKGGAPALVDLISGQIDLTFQPLPEGFRHVPWMDLDALEAAIDPTVAAVLLEPVQGEAGVWPATQGFLQALRQLCDQDGLLLIFDEVQTGCARLGTLFGFEHFGVTPDIMTLGKGLGGGVPIAAVLAQARACVFEHGDHGGTYAGNPLMCAAALAVLNTVSQASFLQNVREMGQMLQQGLQQVSQRLGLGEVRGHGLLLALELGHHSASAALAFGAAAQLRTLMDTRQSSRTTPTLPTPWSQSASPLATSTQGSRHD
jgi:acetylornithine/N-succinyldiaminopimelate aminotransferase